MSLQTQSVQAEGGFITLTIESASGTLQDQNFNLNEPVKAVKTTAMAKLHIDPATADNFRLVYQGNPLPEDRKIGDLGIADGATLVLTPSGATVI